MDICHKRLEQGVPVVRFGEEKGHGHCTLETINVPAGDTKEVSKEQSISYRN